MLLKRYQDEFAGGAVSATWAYLKQWAIGALPPNPLVSHDTAPRHLRDPAFLKRALRHGRIPLSLFATPSHARSHPRSNRPDVSAPVHGGRSSLFAAQVMP